LPARRLAGIEGRGKQRCFALHRGHSGIPFRKSFVPFVKELCACHDEGVVFVVKADFVQLRIANYFLLKAIG
jgi:hypothetical protein